MTEVSADNMVLDVKNLQTVFFTNSGLFRAVDDVSFSVRRGETLAIVGESGCGKSVTALSIMRLVPDPPGRIVGGSVALEGTDLLGLDEAEMRAIRGNRISMIFQEPMTSLNPVMRIGDQITEAVRLHRDMTAKEAWTKAVEMLRLVRIPEPEQRAREYPHQLSGGMRQRAMIAMALACRPALLIADEPTTALDVTIQAQILALIVELQQELGTGLILITHDLGVVAQTAQRVIVMYAGKKVEEATRRRAVRESQASLHPRPDGIDAGGAFVRFEHRRAAGGNSRHGAVTDQPAAGLRLRATLYAGDRALPRRISAVAGLGRPSLCGVLARGGNGGAAMTDARPAARGHRPRQALCGARRHPAPPRRHRACGGRRQLYGRRRRNARDGRRIRLRQIDGGAHHPAAGRADQRQHPDQRHTILPNSARPICARIRRSMQIIFQDPFASLNPRMTAGDIVGEPLSVHGLAAGNEKRQRVAELFDQVGLRADQMQNYPHQFSGGQRQRICIARALSLGPDLIVCDEPVSALDVSIQAQVINLLIDLQRKHGFSYLFIAHDLAVVAHISHRVAVMYLGRIVEIAEKRELFANPRHPYTQALLASVPVANPKKKSLKPLVDGDVPSPINPPSGCAFHTRCRYVMDRCKVETPVLAEAGTKHQVACFLNEGTGRPAT